MRQPWEWIESDLISLIDNQVQESILLDYKACDSLKSDDKSKNELSKDVSAFANSAGGTIVYGIIENNHLPTGLDHGFDPSTITREWIEQVINSRIQRRIDGIRINQVLLTGSRAGKVAYVVHVPQSVRAPHQAFDNKFYRRFNFLSEPMAEYEIRDVMRRLSAPDLAMTFEVRMAAGDAAQDDSVEPAGTLVELTPIVSNASDTPADYSVMQVFIDARVTIVKHSSKLHITNNINMLDGTRASLIAWNHSVPGQMPIFQGVSFRVERSRMVLRLPQSLQYLVAWRLRAPRMGMREGKAYLVSDGTAVTLIPS